MPRKLPVGLGSAGSPANLPPVKPVAKSIRTVKSAKPAASNAPKMSKLQPLPRQRSESASFIAVAVILVFLVIIATGVYFASVYFKNRAAEEAAQQEAQANEPVAETAAPEALVDPAADWLVFNSPQPAAPAAPTAISFKYPAELKLTQNPDNLILSNENVADTQLNIFWVKSQKQLPDYLAALDKVNATGWEGMPSVEITTSTENVVISGWPAVFRQQKLLAADLNQYIAYIKASDTVYAVSLAAPQLDQNLLAFFVTFLNNFKIGQ